MNHAELNRLADRWRRYRMLREFLRAGGAGLLVAAPLAFRWSGWAVAVAAGILVVWLVGRRRVWRVTAADAAAHLNRTYPELEESAGLWLRDPATLDLLERLQLRRIDAAWTQVAAREPGAGGPAPRMLRTSTAWLVAGAAAFALASIWTPMTKPAPVAMNPEAPVPTRVAAPIAPALRSAQIRVEPPAYTARPVRQVEGLDAEAEEGATVRWELIAEGDLTALTLDPGGAGTTPVALEALGGGRFVGRAVLTDTLIYQLAGTRADGSRWLAPDVHAVKVIPDRAPRLSFESPTLSRTVLGPEKPVVAVRLAANDDYGLADVHLVATVARGSGEAVKFRDLTLPLARVETDGDTTAWTRELDPHALELEPGDELYFHAVASDNRAPAPNTVRTETRFVVLPGPESTLTDPGVAVAGVNLIPEYFRSQRQLIIDTQRLVAARPIMPEEAFLRHSDALGVDQKLLRLRYGQFMGEDYEPEAGGVPGTAGVDEHGHVQAGDALPATGPALELESASARARPQVVDEIRQQFMHVHDKPEAATFFSETVKTSLREVLAAMWEAEGYLRIGRPAEALPAENRALELLKALQQSDRIYVKRIGFEPPVLKEAERRLRGELDDVPARAASPLVRAEPDPGVELLRTALGRLAGGEDAAWPETLRQGVDERLTAAARAEPERFMAAVEAWRRPESARGETERALLRRALWSLLPPPDARPHRAAEARPALAGPYFEALGATAEVRP